MEILKMAPRDLYEEYVAARKHPYVIHFAGYQKPWDVVDCDFAEYFWKYAKNSAYFSVILLRCTKTLEDITKLKKTWKNNSTLRKVANLLLPYGSRRRELVKKICC